MRTYEALFRAQYQRDSNQRLWVAATTNEKKMEWPISNTYLRRNEQLEAMHSPFFSPRYSLPPRLSQPSLANISMQKFQLAFQRSDKHPQNQGLPSSGTAAREKRLPQSWRTPPAQSVTLFPRRLQEQAWADQPQSRLECTVTSLPELGHLIALPRISICFPHGDECRPREATDVARTRGSNE